MGQSSDQRARRVIPRGLLGMLALVALVESLLGRFEPEFADWTALCWRVSGARARNVRPCGILVFGSSLSKHGVLANGIEQRTGLRAYNLALFSGPASATYSLFQRAIDGGARPKAILFDCQDSATVLAHADERDGGFTCNLRYWPEFVDLRETLDLSRTARDASLFADLTLSRILCSYRTRFDIRSAVRELARGKFQSRRLGSNAFQRNLVVNRGSCVRQRPTVPLPPPDATSGSPKPAAPVPFNEQHCAFNALAISYIHRLLDLAEAHGTKVFWLMPPISPEKQADRERTGEDDYLTKMARKAQAYSRNVVVIDGRHSGYNGWGFSDEIHLNRNGAVVFTNDVADIVALHLAYPEGEERWVRLPACREVTETVFIEDLKQSVALMSGESVRR